jgi:hypothetical protein
MAEQTVKIIGELLGTIDMAGKEIGETQDEIVKELTDLFISEIYGFTPSADDDADASTADAYDVDITDYIKQNWELYRSAFVTEKNAPQHETIKTDESDTRYCPKKELKSTQIDSVKRQKFKHSTEGNCIYKIQITYSSESSESIEYKYTSIFLNKDIIALRDALKIPDSQTKMEAEIEKFIKPLFENTGPGIASAPDTRYGRAYDKKKKSAVPASDDADASVASTPAAEQAIVTGGKPMDDTNKKYTILDPGTQLIATMIASKTLQDAQPIKQLVFDALHK